MGTLAGVELCSIVLSVGLILSPALPVLSLAGVAVAKSNHTLHLHAAGSALSQSVSAPFCGLSPKLQPRANPCQRPTLLVAHHASRSPVWCVPGSAGASAGALADQSCAFELLAVSFAGIPPTSGNNSSSTGQTNVSTAAGSQRAQNTPALL